jgi:hypothetical protein
VPSTQAEASIVIAAEFLALLAMTWIATRPASSRVAVDVYTAVLGVFVAHAAGHGVLSRLFRGYTPGIVTAVAIIPAVALVLYPRLLREGVTTWPGHS